VARLVVGPKQVAGAGPQGSALPERHTGEFHHVIAKRGTARWDEEVSLRTQYPIRLQTITGSKPKGGWLP
jgi:hypothetical protein